MRRCVLQLRAAGGRGALSLNMHHHRRHYACTRTATVVAKAKSGSSSLLDLPKSRGSGFGCGVADRKVHPPCRLHAQRSGHVAASWCARQGKTSPRCLQTLAAVSYSHREEQPDRSRQTRSVAYRHGTARNWPSEQTVQRRQILSTDQKPNNEHGERKICQLRHKSP